MGLLGVAGIAIIAVYVFAQGRRGRAKERPETERQDPTNQDAAENQKASVVTASERSGTDGN